MSESAAHAREGAPDSEAAALERRLLRLAFDVHDGPMQELIVVGYALRKLRDRLVSAAVPAEREELEASFEAVTTRLVDVEEMLRSLLFSLENGDLGRGSVAEVVQTRVGEFERRTHTAVALTMTGQLELFTDTQRIALDRVLGEMLANVEKHAGATEVSVQVTGDADAVLLQVTDDGRGFDPQAVGRVGIASVGLRSMAERLSLIGGTLRVDSRPGGPSAIAAVIPKWRPETATAAEAMLAAPTLVEATAPPRGRRHADAVTHHETATGRRG